MYNIYIYCIILIHLLYTTYTCKYMYAYVWLFVNTVRRENVT
jgi:hypothetical protein